MTMFKITADGDTQYVEASNKDAAFGIMTSFFGPMPRSLVEISEYHGDVSDDEVLRITSN